MITAEEANKASNKAIQEREKKEMDAFIQLEKEAISEVLNAIHLAVEKGEFQVEIFVRQVFDYKSFELEKTRGRLKKLFSYLKSWGYTIEPGRNDNFFIKWIEPKNQP